MKAAATLVIFTVIISTLAITNAQHFSYEALSGTDNCVVVSQYTMPDCNIKLPEKPIPSILDGSLTVYTSLEEALYRCPYDPVKIDIMGRVYVTEAATNQNLWYNQSKNLVITGIPSASKIQSSLVGLKNFQFKYDNITVEFKNLIIEGCSTKDPLFLSRNKYDQLSPCFTGKQLFFDHTFISNYHSEKVLCHTPN